MNNELLVIYAIVQLIVQGTTAWASSRRGQRAEDAAKEARDTAVDAKQAAIKTEKKIDVVHTLVDGKVLTLLKRIAELTKHPDDIAAASLQEASLRASEQTQKK